jgi:hypothetical protein
MSCNKVNRCVLCNAHDQTSKNDIVIRFVCCFVMFLLCLLSCSVLQMHAAAIIAATAAVCRQGKTLMQLETKPNPL